mmetsp:Transcript_20086/g.43766  ORF Transcript_20086/g.43766 Transcript_20086/m.43766 type:complete len:106 (-) Transcript_20086:133-450(-)
MGYLPTSRVARHQNVVCGWAADMAQATHHFFSRLEAPPSSDLMCHVFLCCEYSVGAFKLPDSPPTASRLALPRVGGVWALLVNIPYNALTAHRPALETADTACGH